MPRRIWQLYSRIAAKWDHQVRPDPGWLRSYAAEVKCPGCYMPRSEWHEQPNPIDVVLEQPPVQGATLASVDSFPVLIRTDLLEALRPHMRGFVIGRCTKRSPNGTEPTEYATLYTPRSAQLEAHRGPHCRHEQCAGCGRVWNNVFWAKGGILARNLDDRVVYQDVLGWIYVDAELAGDLRLREVFPDLRYYKKYPVIAEPLDGQVLPGDSGWNGVLRPSTSAAD
jgi:hypothetical protein